MVIKSLQWDQHQSPELVGGQHPRSFLSPRLRAVLARVCAVSSGSADGTGVVSEDGTGDLPVARPERVRAVDPLGFPVLLAEAAVFCGAPAAAGVREAADRVGLCGALRPDDAQLGRWLLLGLLGVAQPLRTEERAQVHVVVPHVEAVEVCAPGIYCFLHRGHFWKNNLDQFVSNLKTFKIKPKQ